MAKMTDHGYFIEFNQTPEEKATRYYRQLIKELRGDVEILKKNQEVLQNEIIRLKEELGNVSKTLS